MRKLTYWTLRAIFILPLFDWSYSWAQGLNENSLPDAELTEISADDEKQTQDLQIPKGQDNQFSSVREFNPMGISRVLNIRTVIEEGLRKNPNQIIRSEELELVKLNWKDAFSKFWFPTVSVFLKTDNQKIHGLYGGSIGQVEKSVTTKTPQGDFGLSLGEWTVFNWGKDYLQYQSDRATFIRNKEKLGEKKRALKHQLIRQYFDLARYKRFKTMIKDQLRHMTFIYRLGKERVSLKKITRQEFYEIRSEYLKSQSRYHQIFLEDTQKQKDMANLLGDQLTTIYQIEEKLRFKKFRIRLNTALTSALQNYPVIRDSKLSLENSTRSYEKTLKDNLPLPKFSINFGTYTHAFGRNSSHTSYETLEGDSNVEVVASINMTWNIIGENGLFNSRRNDKSYINKRISEIKFYNSKREVEMCLRLIYQEIKHLEDKYEVSVAQLENTKKVFDLSFDNYVSGRTHFDQFRDAWDNLRNAEYNIQNTNYEHLLKKIEVAYLMGRADLPGTPFEYLAQQELTK